MTDIQQDNQINTNAEQERMAVLGQLTARVAHELNNPLDGMLRYVNLSINQLDKSNPEKVPEYLNQVRDGLNQLSSMVASLLDFSRGNNIAEQVTSIDKIIEDAIKFLEFSSISDNIEIVRDYADDLPLIRVGNLPNVFSNIIKNAIQASSSNGKVIIKTELFENSIQINITDSGKGIPEQYINDIFKPFFTTKPSSEGTGLGLAICKEIIEKRSGSISAHNIEQGCVFTITIPATDN